MTVGNVLTTLVAAGFLASCSEADTGLGELSGVASGFLSQRTESAQPRAVITRAMIDAEATPLILVDVPTRDASATMIAVGQNGSHTTWVGGDGVGLSLRDPGLLTSTRGYGGDIISSDVSEVMSALAATGNASATRSMRFLDGAGQDYARSYVCQFNAQGSETIEIFDELHQTRHVLETCLSTDHSFSNEYWLDQSDGWVIRSRQFAGQNVGYLEIEVLHR